MYILTLALAVSTFGSFQLDDQNFAETAIVISEDIDSANQFAAQELQKHLWLITGHKFSIASSPGNARKIFYVGIKPDSDTRSLENEEARYVITDDAIYLYGEDKINWRSGYMMSEIVGYWASHLNRLGTLYAVYSFLENELGVRWIEPGDDGIAYAQTKRINLENKAESWVSQFDYTRGLRTYAWRYDSFEMAKEHIPDAFQLTEEEVDEKRIEDDLWLRRMRMGNRSGIRLQFSHAFTRWWEKYGETNPEFFALTDRGKREPISLEQPDRVKMCVSNPEFISEVVKQYVNLRKQDPLKFYALDASENDGGPGGMGQYCHCENCQELDVLQEGEEFGDHLTDRYVWFYNRCLEEARKQVPDAVVCGFIYSHTSLKPPRKQRVSDGVILQIVPSMADPISETRKLYEDWYNMGARKVLYRPNDLCVDFGLPLGHEERIFEAQKMGFEYGAEGIDHDSIYGYWTGISGINYYILAKAQVYPDKGFQHWMDEYTSVYGNAQADIKAYFQHWREIFYQRFLPAHREMGRLLGWSIINRSAEQIRDYYWEEDFDVTDSYLQRALSRELTDLERQRVEKLIVANRHNRLTFEAIAAINSADVVLQMNKAKELLEFRKEHRDLLRMNWNRLFINQAEYGLETNKLARHYDEFTNRGIDLDEGFLPTVDKLENGSFEDGFSAWTVQLWRSEEGGHDYSGEDVQVVGAGSSQVDKYLHVNVSVPEFDGLYIVHQNVSVESRKDYVFRFRWRRQNPETGSDYGAIQSGDNLLCPRYRLIMKGKDGEQKHVIWGNVSNKSENTDWIDQSRLLSIADMGISQIFVSFFFSTEGVNDLDHVGMLEF